MSNRRLLYTLVGAALLAWVGLLLFTRFVPPTTIPAFGIFFVLLTIALSGTIAPVAYVIGLRFLSSRLYRATTHHAMRQGVLLALCMVLNLVLRALHSWNVFTAIAIFAAAAVVEFLSLARK
jgi:hypothetical protein